MTINNPSFSTSEDDSTKRSFRLDMLDQRPDLALEADPIDPPVAPNRLYGFYNGSSDMVELVITNSTGTRYLRVATHRD